MGERGEFGRNSVTWVLTDEERTLLEVLQPLDEDDYDDAAERPFVAQEKYEVTGRLGRGGMGEVLLVRDRDLRREIAMKVMRDDLAARADLRVRFLAEAQATSQLEHPGIPPVHDLGISASGEVYFTMKVVRGQTLAEVLDDLDRGDEAAAEEYTLHRLVSILERISEALHFAHERGMIHRDLKPENVMLGAFGEVHVMDWGIAKRGAGGEQDGAGPLDTSDGAPGLQTLDGTVKGTVPYMSPEQARGMVSSLDRRSDVYALGCVLYEMLTLRPAFEGEGTVVDLLLRVRKGDFPGVATRNPDRAVPETLADLCTRAMAPERRDRPASARVFGEELREWLDGSAERDRRRREAARLVAQGARAAARYHELKTEVDAAERLAEEESARFAPWQPVAEKRRAIEAGRRVMRLQDDLVAAFADAANLFDSALAQDTEHLGARRALCDLWSARLVDAELAGDRNVAVFAERNVQRHDDGRLAAFLAGDGTLQLASDPPGADVLLYGFEERDGVLTPAAERKLGQTPLGPVELPMGSHLCLLRKAGFREVRYPVHITRNRAWKGSVRLRTEEELGAESVYVPAGPFVCGEGDAAAEETLPDFAIQRFPVTFAEYAEFLAAVEAEEGAGRALELLPRDGDAEHGRDDRVNLMERGDDGAYRPLEALIDSPARERYEREYGADFRARLPVVGVSWHDAVAYCAWKARTSGRPWRLPTDEEREKAARGVDGRRFPWGDLADPSLCKNRDARDEPPQVEPVGTFPTAASVYGMGDAAGNVWDWTSAAEEYARAAGLRSFRGGAWSRHVAVARTTSRGVDFAGSREMVNGFRPAHSFGD